jgi:alpha-1,6-mannosyltransferase
VRGLQVTVFVSVMLTICYYSNGEDALYNPPYLIAWGLIAVLAAVSLVHPDPLRLSADRRRGSGRPVTPPPVAVTSAAGSVAVDGADRTN